MINYIVLAGSIILLASVAGCFVVKKIEDAAVLKNELQEANDDEKRDQKELEIANRPDNNATDLLKRMRREEN